MITRESTLIDICYAVGTALEQRNVVAVLTGGSAATFYAPAAYQSRDADFVLEFDTSGKDVIDALSSIGFAFANGMFSHKHSQFTVEFPKGPLAIGGDLIDVHATHKRGDEIVRVLTPTDAVRDRLASYYYFDDLTALRAAIDVALACGDAIDLDLIRHWTMREQGESGGTYRQQDRHAEFHRQLKQPER